MGRVRVYIASSLDGFIAGSHDDLSWLDEPRPPWAPMAGGPWAVAPEDALGYDAFFAQVGAMLMGRRTYDVVHGMDVAWPYGETPVLVATTRPIEDCPPTVTAVSAPIANLIEEAREAAGDKDVYIDGGNLIRQALDAGLIDEMVVTLHPTILGSGRPLFAGLEHRGMVTVIDVRRFGDGMVQLTLTPVRAPSDDADTHTAADDEDTIVDKDPGEPPLGLA